MKKKYERLTEDQKKRGVYFSTQFASNNSGSNGKIYEILEDDYDRDWKIDRAMEQEDTFWDYLIIHHVDVP